MECFVVHLGKGTPGGGVAQHAIYVGVSGERERERSGLNPKSPLTSFSMRSTSPPCPSPTGAAILFSLKASCGTSMHSSCYSSSVAVGIGLFERGRIRL